jgi:hypothetical protein
MIYNYIINISLFQKKMHLIKKNIKQKRGGNMGTIGGILIVIGTALTGLDSIINKK